MKSLGKEGPTWETPHDKEHFTLRSATSVPRSCRGSLLSPLHSPRSGPRRSRGTGRSVPTEEASRGQPKDRGAGTSVASRGSHVSDEGREANQTRGVTSETASVATKGAKWKPTRRGTSQTKDVAFKLSLSCGNPKGLWVIWSGSVAFGWIISCRILRFTAVSLTSYTRSLRSLITPRSGAWA